MKLTPLMQKFILHWGELGARWGINRTVAQIHALLYISPRPLPAEVIADTLSVARSNVSNSLRELVSWGIIRVVHLLNDRRDHFESLKDVWEMFRVVVEERKRREIDPTVAVLRDCVSQSNKTAREDEYTIERLSELLEFFEEAVTAYNRMRRLPARSALKLIKMGDRFHKSREANTK